MSLQTISLRASDLQFVANEDVELDQKQIMEVWLDDRMLAELRKTDGEWVVTLFTKFQEYQLTLKQFLAMQKQFVQFAREQETKGS